jgi:heme oxygenase
LNIVLLEPSVQTGPESLSAASVSPRFLLRAATAPAHERLDSLYSRLDLARAADYARFLTGHAAAFLPIEAALVKAGADNLIPGWSDDRRGAALQADLAALGLALPAPHSAPVFASDAAVLGGLYVLEGSRLGGAVLARSVPAGAPNAFLKPSPASTWRAFTALLDARLASAAALDEAAAAASAVFGVFEACARSALAPALLESTLRAD